MITIKNHEEIDVLREAGKKLAKILEKLSDAATPGTNANDLDILARELCKKAGGASAFLNYKPEGAERPFPAALCVSINDEVVHGIPNEKKKILREGDIVVLDMGLVFKKMFVDSAVTVAIGGEDKLDEAGKKLFAAGRAALAAGIDAAKAGARTGDVGFAIEETVKTVAAPFTFCLPEVLGGHGVGYKVHEDPFVPNFGMPGQGPVLKPGMVIAIEPIINEGCGKVKMAEDGWTYKTFDGKRSVHFEHTVVITSEGAEILTLA